MLPQLPNHKTEAVHETLHFHQLGTAFDYRKKMSVRTIWSKGLELKLEKSQMS